MRARGSSYLISRGLSISHSLMVILLRPQGCRYERSRVLISRIDRLSLKVTNEKKWAARNTIKSMALIRKLKILQLKLRGGCTHKEAIIELRWEMISKKRCHSILRKTVRLSGRRTPKITSRRYNRPETGLNHRFRNKNRKIRRALKNTNNTWMNK